jgi:hypothetical protein
MSKEHRCQDLTDKRVDIPADRIDAARAINQLIIMKLHG